MQSILFLSFLGAAAALDFQGTGQIRTWTQNGTDLGCLTKQAQWTADETQCDVFKGTRVNNTDIHLTVSTGVPCGLDNVKVACRDDGLSATQWMLYWAGSPFAGHDILGYGEYGLMASTEDYVPTKATDAPVSIQFWGDTDVQPFVWLTWKAT